MTSYIKYIMASAVALFAAVSVAAKSPATGEEKDWKTWTFSVHAGYSVGGAVPVGIPAEIRSLDRYKLCPNLQVGGQVHWRPTKHWGAMAAITFEAKGMNIDASVKNYHINFKQGNQEMEGQFTGHNYTSSNQTAFTVPLCGVYYTRRWNIYAGIYLSAIINKDFEGYAYDGYIRVLSDGMQKGDPTGSKVYIGSEENNRGNYDFKDDMRTFSVGCIGGAEFYFLKHLGVYANITYGFQGIHKSDFTVLDQPLHPLYGTLGLKYKF